MNLARPSRKSETRRPKAVRNPKPEIRKLIQVVGKRSRIVEDRIPQSELFVEKARTYMAVVRKKSLPFAPQLGGTQAMLGGKVLPLYYTSTGLIIGIVPFDVQVDTDGAGG